MATRYSWACVGRGFWTRLAFESADSVRQIHLLSVGGPHPILEGLNRTKRSRKEQFYSLCLTADLGHGYSALGCDSHHWLSWSPGLPTWTELHQRFSWVYGSQTAAVAGLLLLRHCMSQFIMINADGPPGVRLRIFQLYDGVKVTHIQ